MGHLFNAWMVFMVAFLLVKASERILKYYVEDKYPGEGENSFLASRLKTLMAMLRTLLRIVIWLPAISMILSQFGEINITAWITSIGAASFGLTFGFQTIVRDFISGFFIILENNLMVGDEVEVDARSGKVEEITMRTLKIRADNGILFTIPFGTIVVIGNKNRRFSAILMNISVAYNENIEKVQTAVEKSFAALRRIPIMSRRVIGGLEIRGITEVTSYSMVFQVKMKTAPNTQESVRRTFLRLLKQSFDEAGIIVPTPTHTVLRAAPSLIDTQLK
jgi:small conductance mechanosensitive channel